MAYSVAWNEAAPVGASVNAATLDTELQDLKKSVRERMNNLVSNAWETDGDDPKLIDVLAIGATPRLAHVYDNAGDTMATGVNQTIDWPAETIDTATFHDNSTNNSRLTVLVAAYYRLFCNLEILSGATAAVAVVQIRKNGSSTVAEVSHRHNAGTTDENFQIGCLVLAAVDDYYEVRLLQSSGDTWTLRASTAESFFEIEQRAGLT